MNYQELKERFRAYESNYPKTHLTAYITFSSFGPNNQETYSWESRTYSVSSDNKAFQPNKGGYSIFESCLDGKSDPLIRLDWYMKEERGGTDGWIVENCCMIAYLLIECSDISISTPKLFCIYDEAAAHMLSQLAEKGELDHEQLKNEFSVSKELLEDGWYGVSLDSAWPADPCEDWHWVIKEVCLYDPLHISFGRE